MLLTTLLFPALVICLGPALPKLRSFMQISRKNGLHYQIGQGQPDHCKPGGTATDVSK